MLRSIQVLRAAAATGVVIHHADRSGLLGGGARVGAAGVDLFFVISGFIMATVAAKRSPGSFLADRFWRIFPLWLIALTPWLVIRDNDLGTLLTSFTLWPVWNNAFHMPALFVGWSLCFEMLFYAAFALALATGAALPIALFAAAIFAAPLLDQTALSYVGSPMILEFLSGVVIARLRCNEKVAIPLLLGGIAWLAFAPNIYSGIVYGDLAFTRVLAWGVPAALIVYSARSLERHFERFFDLPVLFGHASYAIYLFHPLAIGLSGSFLGGVSLSLIAGLAVHLGVERPLLAMRKGSKGKRVALPEALPA